MSSKITLRPHEKPPRTQELIIANAHAHQLPILLATGEVKGYGLMQALERRRKLRELQEISVNDSSFFVAVRRKDILDLMMLGVIKDEDLVDFFRRRKESREGLEVDEGQTKEG